MIFVWTYVFGLNDENKIHIIGMCIFNVAVVICFVCEEIKEVIKENKNENISDQ